LGVDGSASNDSSDLLGEARQAMLLARLATELNDSGDTPMPAREALELATLGGAAVLGRDDIGALEAGRCADAIAVDLDQVGFSGGRHDPVAALLLCAPVGVDHAWVHGRPVVADGQVTGVDVRSLVTAHGQAARDLLASTVRQG
ncbi:MAG: amidohydrolase family protein, partial [Nitriliruptorales bacterium]